MGPRLFLRYLKALGQTWWCLVLWAVTVAGLFVLLRIVRHEFPPSVYWGILAVAMAIAPYWAFKREVSSLDAEIGELRADRDLLQRELDHPSRARLRERFFDLLNEADREYRRIDDRATESTVRNFVDDFVALGEFINNEKVRNSTFGYLKSNFEIRVPNSSRPIHAVRSLWEGGLAELRTRLQPEDLKDRPVPCDWSAWRAGRERTGKPQPS